MPSKAVKNTEVQPEPVIAKPTTVSLRYTGLFRRAVCSGLLFTRGEPVTLPFEQGKAIAALPNFEIVESE